MDPQKKPMIGSDLLMHLTLPPNSEGKEFFHDIKLLHTESCPSCDGSGNECHNCRGSGHIWVRRKIEVKIPSGIKEGMHLRLNGLGEAGYCGAKSGDLYIEVHFKSHFQLIIEKIFNFFKDPFFKKQNEINSSIKLPSKSPSNDKIVYNTFNESNEKNSPPNKYTEFPKDNEDVCTGCRRIFSKKSLIQCGPCYEKYNRKKLFCQKCWKNHQWTHGRSPPSGIEYHSDGTYSGFDGSEKLN